VVGQVKRRALAARAKSQAAKDAAEALEKKVEKELGPAGEGKSSQ
jgi:hypothetical protein